MSAIYDTNRPLWVGEKKFTGNLLWNSSIVGKFFLRFNFFTGTFKGFYWNIPELLLRKARLSVTLAWNLQFFFVAIIFLGRNARGNKFVYVE